ncbi:MAG: hypothetical protein ACTHM9_08330 [Gemmatimonadales bacterium]
MIALALLLLQTAQPPVLNFPEPGVDDTAAYQGYQTRFYRDVKGNTVQIYIEPKGTRVVNLWADADDESLGFNVRDPAGRAVRVDWAADRAAAGDSGVVRTLEYRLTARARAVALGWFLLGSMRVERDFQYNKTHLRPYGAGTYYVAEESTLVATVARQPADERQRQLELLRAGSLGELRGRLLPSITGRCAPACVARIDRPSLDGRNRLTLEIRADPRDVSLRVAGRTVTLRARRGDAVAFTVRIGTDGAPLTPLGRDSIFTREFLDFVAKAAGDTASLPGRRLEREVRSIELLSSEEKLMAGLPNFATYFGRDMMMAALMMRPIWRPAMSEHVIASVLRKLSPRGDVSHEEALGGQAIREHAAEYAQLMTAHREAAARPASAAADSATVALCDTSLAAEAVREGAAAETLAGAPGRDATAALTWSQARGCTLDAARALLRDLQRTRENYHMLDDEFQLPILEARYLADSAVPAARKRAFLLEQDGAGPPRIARLLRELGLVAEETRAYVGDPRATNLVSFVKRDSTHWRSASWRDSDAGYANGRFAMDINAIWAPRALAALGDILAALPRLGFERAAVDSLAPDAAHGALGHYASDSTALQHAIDVWRGARRHFVVTLSRADVTRGAEAKLAWLPAPERAYWKARMTGRGAPDSLTFLALSLDSAARPIPIPNTDPATELFLDATGAHPVSLDVLEPFRRLYPVGLFIEGLGPAVANDAFAGQRVWDIFAKDAYHGPRVVWGREVNLLLLGLATALDRTSAPAPADTARALAALRATLAAVRASGLEHNELWSYRIEGGRLQPTRYGTSSDVQLWSSTDLAVQYMLSRALSR